MTLEELKQTRRAYEDNATLTMEEIYSRILDCYENGNACYFKHGSSSFEDEISDHQVAQLWSDGYTVEWNRACLWYEVSGW